MIEVASVGLIWNYHILMGRRNDTGLWTLPGGHLEPGENPYVAAERELEEETRIKQWYLYALGSEYLEGRDGITRLIHAYRADVYHKSATGLFDPDGECDEWRWVPFHGFTRAPELAPENLHSKRNLVLKYLGLQTW